MSDLPWSTFRSQCSCHPCCRWKVVPLRYVGTWTCCQVILHMVLVLNYRIIRHQVANSHRCIRIASIITATFGFLTSRLIHGSGSRPRYALVHDRDTGRLDMLRLLRPTKYNSGRMAIWKHYIILFGGFYDPGYRSM